MLCQKGGASAGTFTVTAMFVNILTDTLSKLLIVVQTLISGNVLCNAKEVRAAWS
jgi:hypothetical protein